ncbi:Nitrate ABC transporter, permease protein [Methylophaga thiooxydans]|uniref:Nitrate ABC transporter, permease protein n=1 Tax=Methylophaga thiooxydans TaxID=392484 RepID=A0A0A0BE46_9GAMM|nr:ABC transporter permease [Methylophaga thiooxydans]KGM05982.1 Nitrate ABC transporter, permease protein [Methylophaga thiooxydans]
MKDKLIYFLELTGFTWFIPLVKLGTGDSPKTQLQDLAKMVGVPLFAIGVFLLLWHMGAAKIITSLGQVPGPTQVWEQTTVLVDEHYEEREREQAFIERQEKRNAIKLEKNPDADVTIRPYTGKETFFDQILTSLGTVFVGFLLASVIAIPIGIVAGLSNTLYSAINPLIQIFKPVSPLAWLPIVTMVVSALYVSDNPLFAKSFVTSAITVMLCSLWPTLINTAVGVSSIDKDLINVARVLRLNYLTTIYKVVIPASIPMIFTGLRISLGIGWMVLIAAEMLAQNPGLGKFVWDEFQNGSSESLSRIMVAVLTIGIVGFILDRITLSFQKFFSYDKNATIR